MPAGANWHWPNAEMPNWHHNLHCGFRWTTCTPACQRSSCARDHTPPNADFLVKTFDWRDGVQLFVVVPTVHRGTLGGAYRHTYPHLLARYRGWVSGGVRGTFAVILLSRLLGAALTSTLTVAPDTRQCDLW